MPRVAQPVMRRSSTANTSYMSIAMALRPQAATAPALLKRLSQPLLLIWGLEDRLVPVLVAEQVGRLRPDLPLELIEGSGHCPHDEHPDAFNALLLQWLAQLPGSGPAASPGR